MATIELQERIKIFLNNELKSLKNIELEMSLDIEGVEKQLVDGKEQLEKLRTAIKDIEEFVGVENDG